MAPINSVPIPRNRTVPPPAFDTAILFISVSPVYRKSRSIHNAEVSITSTPADVFDTAILFIILCVYYQISSV